MVKDNATNRDVLAFSTPCLRLQPEVLHHRASLPSLPARGEDASMAIARVALEAHDARAPFLVIELRDHLAKAVDDLRVLIEMPLVDREQLFGAPALLAKPLGISRESRVHVSNPRIRQVLVELRLREVALVTPRHVANVDQRVYLRAVEDLDELLDRSFFVTQRVQHHGLLPVGED